MRNLMVVAALGLLASGTEIPAARAQQIVWCMNGYCEAVGEYRDEEECWDDDCLAIEDEWIEYEDEWAEGDQNVFVEEFDNGQYFLEDIPPGRRGSMQPPIYFGPAQDVPWGDEPLGPAVEHGTTMGNGNGDGGKGGLLGGLPPCGTYQNPKEMIAGEPVCKPQ